MVVNLAILNFIILALYGIVFKYTICNYCMHVEDKFIRLIILTLFIIVDTLLLKFIIGQHFRVNDISTSQK